MQEVKHTRNIIAAHMKMVHLISWKEYQEILIKIRLGENVGDLPAPDLFEVKKNFSATSLTWSSIRITGYRSLLQCAICGVSVKYKREHLNKKHQISEDVYDELIAKKQRGEDITEELPERSTRRCHICDRECLDIRKHLERSHQITEDLYDEMVANGDIREDDSTDGSFSSSPAGAGAGAGGSVAIPAAAAAAARKAKSDAAAALLISNGGFGKWMVSMGTVEISLMQEYVGCISACEGSRSVG